MRTVIIRLVAEPEPELEPRQRNLQDHWFLLVQAIKEWVVDERERRGDTKPIPREDFD